MATPQSLTQSYIQDAVGTQSLAQSNVPVLANNGNPFTIYNQTPPQGGYLPPVANAYDQWRINPAPPPVVFGGGGYGGGFPPFTFPSGGGSGGGAWVPPTAPPPPVVPVVPPSTGGPLPPNPFTPVGGGGGANVLSRNTTAPMSPIGGAQFHIGPGHNPIFGGTSTGTGSAFGGFTNPFSGIKWGDVADMFLPGDVYQNGSWNLGNGIAGLLGAYTGLPVEAMANWAGSQNWAPDFLRNFADKNANAFVQERYGPISQEISAKFANHPFNIDFRTNGQIGQQGLVAAGQSYGWGVGQINPITGQMNTPDNVGQTPFAQNPNNMPTGFGPFNPGLPQTIAPSAGAARGTIGTTGAMAGGAGGFGGLSHYGGGYIGPPPGSVPGSPAYEAGIASAQAAAAGLGLGSTNFASGARFGGAGALGWAV